MSPLANREIDQVLSQVRASLVKERDLIAAVAQVSVVSDTVTRAMENAKALMRSYSAVNDQVALMLEARERLLHDLVPSIEWIRRSEERYRTALPENLRELDGIPLAWIPRQTLVEELLGLPDQPARLAHLVTSAAGILEDCRDVFPTMTHRWAAESLEAVDAYEKCLSGRAQSHAANIIDSIVLDVGGSTGRRDAAKRAQTPLDDAPYLEIGDILVIKPLIAALTGFHPNPGAPVPSLFSRHATAHALGRPGVSSPEKALVAVMLATSLARHYG